MSEKIEPLNKEMMSLLANLNIHQRILGIMSELHYIAKGDKTVNGQYRFVSHDQVTAKIHPLLVKYGILIIPTVDEMTQDGNRTIVNLLMSFTNVDNRLDSFTIKSVGYGVDSGDKGPGKAISYAYKYGILKTFCLETGDDPDNDAESNYEPAKCLEFDSMLPTDMTEKDKTKLKKFLSYSSQVLQKHIEDVKREAMKRPEDFLKKFHSWSPKKKEEE
jgi:ERF superfamily